MIRPWSIVMTLLAVALAAVPPGCGAVLRPTTQPSAPAASEAPPAVGIAQRIDAPPGVLIARLTNGLTVIIHATRTSPVVCVQCYVKAGSMFEGPWLGSGISHLVEHLVADGPVRAAGAPQGQIQKTLPRVADLGGQSNAFTDIDSTCYHINSASANAMACIDLVADWLARAVILREDFEREHGVVQRERELEDDDAEAVMEHASMRNVYRDHPAAEPIVGRETPLRDLTYDDVLAYHKRTYVPQNMVFVVVGDVDPEKALDRCCEAMAGFESQRAPDLSLPPVSRLVGVRRVTALAKGAQEVQAQIAFQTVPILHEDYPALELLGFLLGHDESSRLVQEIQRGRQLVTSIGAEAWSPEWGPGEFTISYRCPTDKASAAEGAILDELRKFRDQGVDEAQLGRAKRQKLAETVLARQAVDVLAEKLALSYLATGDAGFDDRVAQRIQRLTGDDVRRVAAKYLDPQNMAVTSLVPEKSFSLKAAPAAKADQAQASVFALPNGFRAVLVPVPSAKMVSMAFVTAGGVLLEDPKTNGLGMLMAQVSTKGAGKRSAEDIIDFFAEAGGSLDAACARDALCWQAVVLDDRFDQALDIFADTILRPTFPAKELAIAAPALKADILRQKTEVTGELFLLFREKFFAGSPYAMDSRGSELVVDAATVQRLAEHHARCVKAGSSVLAIYGHFDPAAARKKIESLFAALPAGKVSLPSPPPRRVAPQGEFHLLTTDKANASVLVAVGGTKVDDRRDRFALDVLVTILSGYDLPAGWLFEELRGKKLVYDVHGRNEAGLAPGAFLAYAVCEPDNAPRVVEIIRRNLRKAAAYQPTQNEIDRAVNEILTVELLGSQALLARAVQSAVDEMEGFGYDFHRKMQTDYRKVTPADVLGVARKYLGGGYCVVVTTPKPELFGQKPTGPQTQPAGPQTKPASTKPVAGTR